MCEDGLVNSARGEVVGFKWSDGADHQAQPGILPAAVMLKFHDPPGCDSGVVEIMPILPKNFTQQGVTLQRTQLPLVPSWSATIYKVSLDAA